jgi:hypothetical protein
VSVPTTTPGAGLLCWVGDADVIILVCLEVGLAASVELMYDGSLTLIGCATDGEPAYET